LQEDIAHKLNLLLTSQGIEGGNKNISTQYVIPEMQT